MKRGLILLFFLMIIIPATYATLSIDGPDKSVYNLGDNVEIAGYVITSNAFTGFLGLTLNCNGNKFQLPSTSLTLNPGEKKDLKSELQLPKITISSFIPIGLCVVEASLISGSNIVEYARSKEFAVKKDLRGSFDIDVNRLQIGKSFRLTGNIYKMDGKNTDGGVEIYFKNNETKFLVDIANTNDGKLDYSYRAIQIPEGDYNIDLFVNDIYGNQMLFENVAKFTLISQITLSARASETTLKPGDKFKVYGDVRSPLENAVLEGSIKINMGGNEYVTQIKNSKFEYAIELPTAVKSGKHTIKIFGQDKNGNSGNTEVTIYVTPIQKELKLRINDETLAPKETLEITPLLYDQAADLINEEVSIEVYNSKKKLVFADAVKSNSISRFVLPDDAFPGSYEIKLSTSKLKVKSNFQVSTANELDINLANQSIMIKNIGNVIFNNPVKIILDPNQITIVKSLSLKPQKEIGIDLSREIEKSGTYDITVIYNDKIKEFKNIMISGKRRTSLDNIYYLLAIAFLLWCSYVSYIRFIGGKKIKLREEHEKLRAKKDLKHLRELKEKKQGGEGSYRFSYKNLDKEQAVSDFKHSYINKLKEPEVKEESNSMLGFMDK